MLHLNNHITCFNAGLSHFQADTGDTEITNFVLDCLAEDNPKSRDIP